MSTLVAEQFIPLLNDEEHLKKITQEHPWCSIAQLYLSVNYKKNNNSLLEDQVQKTALFFRNTNWLNFQLHSLSDHPAVKENVEVNKVVKEITSQNTIAQPSSEETLAFEPYHTVDYFASQGIKFSDNKTNDKLSVQMKSFTEWLKSMKKINAENLQQVDEQTEKNIQHIAEGSNTISEVVTESMAEVLIKQGKSESAIEIYQKLSLLNPSKMAYFAAQIDRLKTS